MAYSVAINGTSYADFSTAFAGAGSNPVAGIYYCLDPFGDPPREGPLEYDEMSVKFTGKLDGFGRKRMYWKGREIYVDLVVADTDDQAAETRKNTFFDTITGLARFSITVPGGTARPGCKLLSHVMGPWYTIGTCRCVVVKLLFLQMSTTN